MKYFVDFFMVKILALSLILLVAIVIYGKKKEISLNEVLVKATKIKSRIGIFILIGGILFTIYLITR